MAPHSSTLAWKIPWMEEPGGLQSMGPLRVGHNSVTSLSLFTFTLEKEMATHSSCLAWIIPWRVEPGGQPSMGSHRVGHDWSNLAAAAAIGVVISLFVVFYLDPGKLRNWGWVFIFSNCLLPLPGQILKWFSFLSLSLYAVGVYCRVLSNSWWSITFKNSTMLLKNQNKQNIPKHCVL